MNELDKLTKEIQPNKFIHSNDNNKLDVNDIVEFFIDNNIENKSSLVAGRVYQKNKKNDIIETIFKLIEEEIKKMESKNNKDSDASFFNLNKKILSNNVYNLKEIIRTYDIDVEKISYFIIGTLIQYVYESKR